MTDIRWIKGLEIVADAFTNNLDGHVFERHLLDKMST
jgi:hypothetical protein